MNDNRNLRTETFYIKTFDIDIERELCSAFCINESGKRDICAECLGKTEATTLCPYADLAQERTSTSSHLKPGHVNPVWVDPEDPDAVEDEDPLD